MRDLVLAGIVFGSLPFVLKRPFWGVLLLAWLGYMNPHRLCYGFMLEMPVVQIVAIATLVGMLMSKEAKRLVWSREMTLLVVFVAWMGLTTTQALYQELAIIQYVKVLKIQILTAMTLLMLTSREKVRAFVWVIVLSLGYYGIKGGLFTIAHGGVYRVQGPFGTFIGGNNELALAMTMTIPLMRYLQLEARGKWVRLGLLAGMALTAISAVGSQSRGALVALAATGLLFWLKSRNKVWSGLLIVALVAVVADLMPASWYERMDTIKTYDSDASALGRINAWWMAWNMARDRFFGGGFESFLAPSFQRYAPVPHDVHDSHSIYFQMMGHHGFVGLGIFLALLAMTWWKCGTVIRLAKKNESVRWAGNLAAMLQVSLTAYMVGGAFLGLGYFDYLYHLIALVVVTYDLARRALQAQGAGAPSAAQPAAAAAQPQAAAQQAGAAQPAAATPPVGALRQRPG